MSSLTGVDMPPMIVKGRTRRAVRLAMTGAVGVAVLTTSPVMSACSSSKSAGFAPAGTLPTLIPALDPSDLRQSAFRFAVALNGGDSSQMTHLLATRCSVAATNTDALEAEFASAKVDFGIPPDLTTEDLGDTGTSQFTGPAGSTVTWHWTKENGEWRIDSCS